MNVLAMLQREDEESLLLEFELDSVSADGAMQPLQDKRRGDVGILDGYSKYTHDMQQLASNNDLLMTDTLLVKVNER